MDTQEDDFIRVFIWILVLLVFFTMVIILIARAIGLNENSGPMTDKDVHLRTAPYGAVIISGQPSELIPVPMTTPPPKPVALVSKPPVMDGQTLYAPCAACHASGIAGAPIAGDSAAWATRLAGGFDGILQNATNGIRGMPARGGQAYSDEQMRVVVQYMVEQSR